MCTVVSANVSLNPYRTLTKLKDRNSQKLVDINLKCIYIFIGQAFEKFDFKLRLRHGTHTFFTISVRFQNKKLQHF